MTTAGAVAIELRRIADAFEKNADAVVVKPILTFYHGYMATKEEFVSLAKVFPRPFDKGDGFKHEQFTLTHHSEHLEVYASIERSAVCEIVEHARPAVYRCAPILGEEDDTVAAGSEAR